MPAKKTVTKLEIVEPLGLRVLLRKDEDRKTTKSGIHLPDKIEIPTITGRVVAVSGQIDMECVPLGLCTWAKAKAKLNYLSLSLYIYISNILYAIWECTHKGSNPLHPMPGPSAEGPGGGHGG